MCLGDSELLLYLTVLLLNLLLEKVITKKETYFLSLEIKYQFWESFQEDRRELIGDGEDFLMYVENISVPFTLIPLSHSLYLCSFRHPEAVPQV